MMPFKNSQNWALAARFEALDCLMLAGATTRM